VTADGGDGRPGFTADAVEAARLAREVQDLGFDAAQAIVDRFSDLFGQFCATAMSPMAGDRRAGTGDRPAVHLGADGDTYRRLQSDMRRSADSYLSVLSQLNDLSLRFFDVARPAGGSEGGSERLDLPDVGPGGRTSARMWLHNTTPSPVTGVRVFTPGLTSHAGNGLPSGAVSFVPDRIEHLGAGESREILVAVRPGDAVPPGTYHGQVLVERLPDAAFPLTVRVQPRASVR
jgi:hypothetical protein